MSEKRTITATVPANPDKGIPEELQASVEVDAPETGKEAIEMFGDEAVLTNSMANWVITLQGNIRSALRRGEDAATIAGRLAGAKMGVAQKGVKIDPVQAYMAKFAAATPDEQAKMLADLKAKAKK